MRFAFKPWLMKARNGKPIPMRVMVGSIVQETEKAYYIEIKGKPEPSVDCLHCGRKLTNEVSMFYGLGPICGKHFGIKNITHTNLKDSFKDIRARMDAVRWKGWVPKAGVDITFEVECAIIFKHKGLEYKVVTTDETKVQEVLNNADVVLSHIKRQV